MSHLIPKPLILAAIFAGAIVAGYYGTRPALTPQSQPRASAEAASGARADMRADVARKDAEPAADDRMADDRMADDRMADERSTDERVTKALSKADRAAQRLRVEFEAYLKR